jgi:hypothetical protein
MAQSLPQSISEVPNLPVWADGPYFIILGNELIVVDQSPHWRRKGIKESEFDGKGRFICKEWKNLGEFAIGGKQVK